MNKIEEKVAAALLRNQAVKLQPTNPFTWASGLISPIYCNNRKMMSLPSTREEILDPLTEKLLAEFPQVETLAAVSTSGILWGAIIAEEHGLNFVSVRSEKKDHGTKEQIDGDIDIIKGTTAVVVEDLISTGGSSLKVVEALRAIDVEVLGMIAIFTYDLPIALESFKKEEIQLETLTNYSTLLEVAVENKYINQSDVAVLQEWREDVKGWWGKQQVKTN
jgi:orotate phosphoribosyltransferase